MIVVSHLLMFAAGVLSVWLGVGLGIRRECKRAETQAVSLEAQTRCSCKHQRGNHRRSFQRNPFTGELRPVYEQCHTSYLAKGPLGKEWVRCPCQEYHGPIPPEELLSQLQASGGLPGARVIAGMKHE